VNGVLVVGAGLAGTRCAESLRSGGYERPIVVVGEEHCGPYERPALSKDFLAGKRSADTLQLRGSDWWDERNIEMQLGTRVEGIDAARKTASLGGHTVHWEHVVLATGARPRRLPGTPLPGAHVLRSLADAVALRETIGPGSRLVIVGAGFVGAEVASTCAGLGAEVVILEAEPVPLSRAIGPEVGRLLADRWLACGIDVRLGARIERIEGNVVELGDGTVLPYDALLIAIGAEPAGELLDSPRGIQTDAFGRTSFPGVFACGDVAHFGGSRVEHWTSASGQAATVAAAILGEPRPYAETPYFWSDQFGVRLQMVGSTEGCTTVEIEGDTDSFAARYTDDEGRIRAVLLANRPREIAAARRELAAAA